MKKVIELIAWILVIIGALNWGLVGVFNFDLVEMLLGEATIFSRAVYILVGVSAILLIIFKLMGMKNMSGAAEMKKMPETAQ